MNYQKFIELLSSEQPMKELTNILIDANEDALKRGASMGWVMALSLDFGSYKEIFLDESRSQNDVDEYFVSYYSSDFDETIKCFLIEYSEILPAALESLLNESIWAYENQKYQICIPALFSIIEGALVDLSNNGERKNIRYKQGLDDTVSDSSLNFAALPLISLSWFLDYAFKKSDFDQSNFVELNRHWALHGRYLDMHGVKPALQLFSVVALILFCYELQKV
ncbi:hypothetical protein [Vibrio splendidus]|uniref:hypothetical protein n=1 Tax=Vibrio splendidus TaxID=29497 RepID=UPI000CB6371B|nr:hypothetical protein [Vibrio splendidus]PMI50442.1 hypothetical protein BCU42_10515 [Vibrio splendidus]